MSSTLIIILYDGAWEKNEGSWNWNEKGQRSKCIMVEPNITFNELLDEIYGSTEIDHNCFDVELSYKPKTTIDIAPIAVKNDKDVMAFICWQKKDNIPLCVTLVRKFENIAFKEIFVPELDDIEDFRENNDDKSYSQEDDDNNDDDEDDGGGGDGDGDGDDGG
ncbi:hypothetical protein TorRG33x02_144770, partial [Trema orientale]